MFRSDHSKYGNGSGAPSTSTNGDKKDGMDNFYFSSSTSLIPHVRKNILMVRYEIIMMILRLKLKVC